MSRTQPGFFLRLLRISLVVLSLMGAAGILGVLVRTGRMLGRLWVPTAGDLVEIPGGTLTLGCAPAPDPYCAADELPTQTVAIAPFRMDRTEVANGAYRACVRAGKCPEPARPEEYHRFFRRDHPVVGVTWFEAQAYCRWRGARLPAEAEWEWAARGPEARIWPWGNQFECSRVCGSVRPCRSYSTCPVGSHPSGRSRGGVADLAGNAWEWVADRYAPYGSGDSGVLLTPGQEEAQPKVIRGGSWQESEPYSLRASERSSGHPGQAYGNVGFRCAQSLPEGTKKKN